MLYADETEKAMPTDKLGRFMTSNLFLVRANAAVAQAVHRLKEQNISPTYIQRARSNELEAQPTPSTAQESKERK